MANLGKGGPFDKTMRHLRPRKKIRFPDDLQGVDTTRIFLPRLHNRSQAASPHSVEQFEVV